MAKPLGLGLLLLALVVGSASAGPEGLPTPIVDAPDLLVHRVETACNSYLITCRKTGRYVLVDPGNGLDAALAAQKAEGRTLVAVWITHEHGDHLTGLAPVLARFEVPVYAHGLARDAIAERGKGYGQPPPIPDRAVADGDVLSIGDTRWKALHLPGHAPGSLGYLLPGRVLVAGDVLFQGSVGRTDLGGSDPEAFAKALGTKLWDLPDPVVVLPGHGPHTTIGVEKKENRLFQDFARKGRGEAPIPRPWMGIQIDQAFAGPGVRLTQVVQGSPAATAGLQVGDIVTGLDGVRMRTFRDLVAAIAKHAVGDEVAVVYSRAGTARTTELTFKARGP